MREIRGIERERENSARHLSTSVRRNFAAGGCKCGGSRSHSSSQQMKDFNFRGERLIGFGLKVIKLGLINFVGELMRFSK